ncbi:uncharacterized protein I206_106679 [Kwoniella pini CBS 10737]|uniref:Uncharacterized protein n=1 Tax=Kwoniella pini CBS 10737 TaxID=1296096 RepID=A0A1B9HTJ4_9TREE|nr:uncharacterized protein I206_07432 [Kwoniella pini CBS 10737]OCF46579.1 hypothetical protein I206_07432 [Kwoniella pini CBS 10737]
MSDFSDTISDLKIEYNPDTNTFYQSTEWGPTVRVGRQVVRDLINSHNPSINSSNPAHSASKASETSMSLDDSIFLIKLECAVTSSEIDWKEFCTAVWFEESGKDMPQGSSQLSSNVSGTRDGNETGKSGADVSAGKEPKSVQRQKRQKQSMNQTSESSHEEKEQLVNRHIGESVENDPSSAPTSLRVKGSEMKDIKFNAQTILKPGETYGRGSRNK